MNAPCGLAFRGWFMGTTKREEDINNCKCIKEWVEGREKKKKGDTYKPLPAGGQ